MGSVSMIDGHIDENQAVKCKYCGKKTMNRYSCICSDCSGKKQKVCKVILMAKRAKGMNIKITCERKGADNDR